MTVGNSEVSVPEVKVVRVLAYTFENEDTAKHHADRWKLDGQHELSRRNPGTNEFSRIKLDVKTLFVVGDIEVADLTNRTATDQSVREDQFPAGEKGSRHLVCGECGTEGWYPAEGNKRPYCFSCGWALVEGIGTDEVPRPGGGDT